jgi:hypothetical protein
LSLISDAMTEVCHRCRRVAQPGRADARLSLQDSEKEFQI